MSGLLPAAGSLPPNQLIEAQLPRVLPTPDGHAGAPIGELGDLKEVLAIIRRRKWLVLFIAGCASAVAGYFAYKKTPIYLAAASVRIADERHALSGGIADAPRDNIGSNYWVDPVLSQIQVLKSREVAAEAIKRQPFGTNVLTVGFPTSFLQVVHVDSVETSKSLPTNFGTTNFVMQDGEREIRAAYGQTVSLDGLSFRIISRPPHRNAKIVLRTTSDAIGVLLDGVEARPRKSTDVVDVTYRANDPVVAQQVVNTIISAYKDVNAATSQQQSVRRREFIQEQLKQTDSLFADATTALSTFRSREQVYGSDARVAAEQSGLMTLDVSREELTADKRTLQSLLDNLQNTSGPRSEKLDALLASPGVATNPVVTSLFQQLIELRTSRDSLSVGKWGAAHSHPDVQKLDTLISTTQAELLSAVRSNIDAVNARLTALNDLRSRNANQLQKLPSVQAVEARLLQRVETARKMADQLREEFQRARISEAVEVGQVEIVDFAMAPNFPIGRSSLFRVLTGLLIGLIVGGGAAVMLERLNTTVRRRDDIESLLRIPGLAVIPQIASMGKLGVLGRGLQLPGRRNRRERVKGETLVTLSDFGSISAEAFRTLRTNLIFSQSIQTLKTMVVTSPSPQDGKTTTSANLAVTFAQQGMRVLLIDCDMRKARLHNMFQVAREPGFSQLLARQAAVKDVIRETAVENLFLIPAGLLPANPSELVGSAIARATIESLAKEYDIVIIDTPPVHVAAEALILGSMANGVLMVLRAGYSERGAALEAIQRLNNVGAHVLGAVLNDPDHKVPEYGSYYYYYDYHDEKVEA
jgi:polysaccharide biosynthesis transport protein